MFYYLFTLKCYVFVFYLNRYSKIYYSHLWNTYLTIARNTYFCSACRVSIPFFILSIYMFQLTHLKLTLRFTRNDVSVYNINLLIFNVKDLVTGFFFFFTKLFFCAILY